MFDSFFTFEIFIDICIDTGDIFFLNLCQILLQCLDHPYAVALELLHTRKLINFASVKYQNLFFFQLHIENQKKNIETNIRVNCKRAV